MEENQTQLFSLTIDPLIKSHLSETARWAKFLAILGFVICGLIVVAGIFFGTFFSTLMSRSDGQFSSTVDYSGSFSAVIALVYIIIAVVYFFPCLYLLRFSNSMRTALNGNGQSDLSVAFQNLKSLFRYVGIITVIVLGIYLIIFLFAMLGAAFVGS